jgi:4-hydroxy-3-polyprenylbenzoate decarboxylase
MLNRGIALGITGASGALYGLRLLECLLAAGEDIYLTISDPGRMVLGMEANVKLPSRPTEVRDLLSARYAAQPDQLRVFGLQDWAAPLASGSNAPRAMVVCPCTSGTLASIAAGHSRNLIERAADVILKEGRKLILVPRETPFSPIHLENMLRLAKLGVVILPASPGFYHNPTQISELVDFIVARVLDQLQVEHHLLARWGAARG